MRRRAIWALGAVLLAATGPASARPSSATWGVRGAVAPGRVSVSMACTIRPDGPQGAWIAAFSVDAYTGLTESSVMAIGWWNAGRTGVTVRAFGRAADTAPVSVTALPERGLRVTVASSWGGTHRSWAASLHGGCAATDGAVLDPMAAVGGEAIDDEAPVRIVTAGAEAFGGPAIEAAGMTVASGETVVDAGYLVGVFSARSGRLTQTLPDGSVRTEDGLGPSIGVRGGFGGRWRFEVATAVSDDPYVLTALAFGD